MIDNTRVKLIVIDQRAPEKYTTCTHRSLKASCRIIEIEYVTYTLHNRHSLSVNIRRLIFWEFWIALSESLYTRISMLSNLAFWESQSCNAAYLYTRTFNMSSRSVRQFEQTRNKTIWAETQSENPSRYIDFIIKSEQILPSDILTDTDRRPDNLSWHRYTIRQSEQIHKRY